MVLRTCGFTELRNHELNHTALVTTEWVASAFFIETLHFDLAKGK